MSKLFYTILLSILSTAISFAANVTSATLPKPFFFTENKGQWDEKVLYKCSARNGMTWFLERDGITLLASTEDRTKPPILDPMDKDLPEMMRRHPARYPMKSHALKFRFLASNTNDSVSCLPEERSQQPSAGVVTWGSDVILYSCPKSIDPQHELSWHNNYFLGNDSSKWAPDCRNFSSIIYRDVWDGIDIEWYENAWKLEFDFIVQPGAEPSQIRMSCEGLEGTLAPTGNDLSLPTSLGTLHTALPSVYQISAGGARNEIEAQFEISSYSNTFGITFPKGYNSNHTLRIDPLIWSTFLGGEQGDGIDDLVIDHVDQIIVTGYTTSWFFPVTSGAIDSTSNDYDCFVTKLSSDGSHLLYSTYLGGSNTLSTSGIDLGNSICLDGFGSVIVGGETGSDDFPVTNGSWLSGISDGFITRLNAIGNQIIYSTTLGGLGYDFVYKVISDSSGGFYAGGVTGSGDFPTTTGAYRRTSSGGVDCFIVHINNTATQLLASTYLGSSNADGLRGLLLTEQGIIVAGVAGSATFPTTAAAYDTSFNGGTGDVFVTKFDLGLTHLIYSTFIGGSGFEGVWNMVNSSINGIIIVGETRSPDFPTTPGAYYSTPSDSLRGFIANLDSTGSQILGCSLIGDTSAITNSSGVVVDSVGVITITGSTTSLHFPTTHGCYDSTFNGGYSYYGDCYISQFNSNCTQLMYSTYLGGLGYDRSQVIVQTTGGDFVVAGMTASSDFPTTNNSYDPNYNGGPSYFGDGFITRIQLYETAVQEPPLLLPKIISLSQNFPNPFNSSTTISYSIPTASAVSLKLYDLTGREISTLVDQQQSAGSYRVQFDGKWLASGTYFVQLQAGEKFSKVQKLVVLK